MLPTSVPTKIHPPASSVTALKRRPAYHKTELPRRHTLQRFSQVLRQAEAAMVDVINQYARFALPKHWGSGRAPIADGTHVKPRDNNLLGSRHIRYGGYGVSPTTTSPTAICLKPYLYVSESGESPIAPSVAGFNCPFGCSPRPC
jgi:Tn3 transposase DDE domain